MNTVVTSREAILQVSRTLIREQGWVAINIRTVAAACGVSVGSIYNYFGSKAELVSATVESVWQDIFRFPEDAWTFESFSSCVEWIFASMEKGGQTYPGFFTLHSMSFLEEDKADGQQRMEQAWRHIQRGLYTALMGDARVRPGAFDGTFTAQGFVDIIFSLILSSLFRQSYDCSAIVEMVKRTIY